MFFDKFVGLLVVIIEIKGEAEVGNDVIEFGVNGVFYIFFVVDFLSSFH